MSCHCHRASVALLLLGLVPGAVHAAGEAELGFDRPGDLPALKANASEPLVIEKLRFTDCRTLRGQTAAPIDGRTDTRIATWSTRRYPVADKNSASAEPDDPGLHMRLGDRQGFHFIRVFGDCEGALFRDVFPPGRGHGVLVGGFVVPTIESASGGGASSALPPKQVGGVSAQFWEGPGAPSHRALDFAGLLSGLSGKCGSGNSPGGAAVPSQAAQAPGPGAHQPHEPRRGERLCSPWPHRDATAAPPGLGRGHDAVPGACAAWLGTAAPPRIGTAPDLPGTLLSGRLAFPQPAGFAGGIHDEAAGWRQVRSSSRASKSETDLLKKLLITEVKTEGGVFRKLLPSPTVTSAVSFFGRPGGALEEIGFYRVGPPDKPYRAAGEWWLTAPMAAPPSATSSLAARFGPADRTVAGASPETPKEVGAISLPARSFVHFVVGPLSFEEGLTAIELDLRLEGLSSRCPLTVRVQDPLNRRQELMAADVAVSGSGRALLILDFPNQVLPDGAYLWLSIAARDAGRIVTGRDGSRLRLLAVPRDSALPEALAYRKLFLKSCFNQLTGEMPGPPSVSLAGLFPGLGGPGGDAVRELYETLFVCQWLDPDDPEVAAYERMLNLRHPPLPWSTIQSEWSRAAGPDTGVSPSR